MGVIKKPETTYFKHGPRCVLLLHAYSGSPNDMRMLGRYLEKADYTCYSPLFTGHGTFKPEDVLNSSTAVWWQDVEKSIAFLIEEGYQQIAILGLSMGGIFALNALTLNLPQIIGGGAFCSPIFPERKTNIVPSFMEYSQKLLTYGKVPEAEQATRLPQIHELVKIQLKDIQDFSSKVGPKLGDIRVPVFLAQSGKDEMIDPETVNDTEKALINAQVEVHWYPESSHVLTVGKEHHELEADVLNFLNKLPWI